MPFEETENEIRHPIKDAGLFIEDSFRSKDIGDGIRLILGKLKSDPDSMVIQSIRFDKDSWTMEKAKKWWKEHKKDFSIPTIAEKYGYLHSLQGVEIFSSGTWNGDVYQDDDLDQMVRAFNETRQTFRPPVKLGHTDNQTLLQQDGLPAAGWIGKIYRKGKKLLADLVDIPDKIYALLQNKAYAQVSCEIIWNANINGQKYPYLLSAIALLGADLPAVTNLDTILSMYRNLFDDGQKKYYSFNQDGSMIESSNDLKDMRDGVMGKTDTEIKLEYELDAERKKLSAKEEELKKIQTDLANKEATVKEFSAKFDAIENELKASRRSYAEIKIEKEMTELLSEKLISPSMKPYIAGLLKDAESGVEPKQYVIKINEKEEKISRFELVKRLLKLHSDISSVNFTENSEDHKVRNERDEKALDLKIQKYANEHKVSYSEAYKAVMRSPGLM